MHRRFLFLQGPVGPFFRLLGASLRRAGHAVYRVNLNGADLFDWPRSDAFRGKRDAWPSFIRAYATARDITDLVVFGDCRPWHRLAIDALKAGRPGLRVHVMEEGYIRPDWITLESDGVNGYSRLHELNGHFSEVSDAEWAAPEPLPTSESAMLMGARATLAYLSMFCLARWFPHYEHHRPLRPHQEACAWLKKLFARKAVRRRAHALQTALFKSEQPYYLVLLQIDADKQVQEHSAIRSMSALLECVVPSFVKHAPADARLVVKAHPLDPAARQHASRADHLARSFGVVDRVVFMDGGELGALINHSRGCVTINSTSGISVLHRGKPLHVFGKAVYSGPGLTHARSIDEFWSTSHRPDHSHYEAFRRVVISRSQVNGNFYARQGMTMAISEVVYRLTGAPEVDEVEIVAGGIERMCQDEAVST